MAEPIRIAADRSMLIPAGKIVKTAYAPIFNISLSCRDRMSIGDVDKAYQKRLQLGKDQPWPPPIGWWEGEKFVISDGRHEYVAALMLGHDNLLVAWMEDDD